MKLMLESWRRYLDEVEALDAITTSQDEIQQSLDYFYNDHAPSKGHRKEVGEWRGYKMVSFVLPEGDILFFAVDEEDRAKAYVGVTPFRESYAVGNVRKTKGGGFYTNDLYEWLTEKFGSLYSDKAQTEDGKGIWERLPEKEEVDTEKEDGRDEEGNHRWRWRLSK